jgi:hypothetical protein
VVLDPGLHESVIFCVVYQCQKGKNDIRGLSFSLESLS